MAFEELKLSCLADYAQFIYENFLDSFTEAEMEASHENQLPLLKYFENHTQEETFQITKRYIVDYLQNFINGTAVDGIIAGLKEWKEDKLVIPRTGVSPVDMALLEKGRKSILLKFLPFYTKDLKKALKIVNEMENYYSFQSVKAIEYFSDIQNEEIIKKNQELTHAYRQLKESNEELIRTEELLQESNDNLEDIIKARTAQILESEERYKAFINQSSEGIWRLELNGIDGIPVNLPVAKQIELLYSFGYFAECNVRMARMHGYEDISSVLDKKLQDIMSFANFSPYGYFNSFIESGYNLTDAESLEIDSEGRIVYILNNIQGVVENGKLVRAWGTQRDITDEKNTEERLRYVVNNAPIIIWSLDKAGNVVLAEGKTLMPEMQDKDNGDGKISLKELKYLPELSASAMRALEGEAFAKIIKIGDKSFEAHFSPLKDYTGKVTGAVNVAIDITERVTIEKKLLESEDRLRLSIEAADLGTWDITDLYGEFVWDERSKRFFGLSKNAKVNYEVFLNGIHHEDRDYVKSAIDATLREEGKDDIDVEFRTIGYEDKVIRWIRIRGKAFFKKIGEPYRFIGTSQDITNKKEQETELKTLADKLSESQYRLSLITNAIPAFVSYIGPDKKYIFANNYYKRLFPNGEVIIGKTISEVVGEECTAFFYAQFEKAVREKRNVTFDHVLNKEDVGFFNSNIRVTYIPDIDENGMVRGVVAMGIDITESIRYERDLEKKNKELSKINSDLDNFIYTASHDLKAPVTNIEGLVSSLVETLEESNCSLSDETRMVVSLIKDSVGRFQITIKDLSEIGKIQKNFVEDVSYINVKEIIEETELSIENKIQEANADIDLEINDCPAISFSRSNFRSVVYNLLTNALKYRSPERKPYISIRCKVDKDYNILEFKDNGLGMKEHLKTRIFQMFKRLHDHVEGTGVGLYLVKRIIDNSGGKIEVDTKEGEGSVFRVFFRNSPNILSG